MVPRGLPHLCLLRGDELHQSIAFRPSDQTSCFDRSMLIVAVQQLRDCRSPVTSPGTTFREKRIGTDQNFDRHRDPPLFNTRQ